MYIFLIAVNGGLLYLDSVFDVPISTPLDNTEITGIAQPNIIDNTNPSGTLLDDVTNNVNDSTNTSNPFHFITDSISFGLQIIYNLIQLLTGAFVWQMLALFGLPVLFVGTMQTILGLFLVFTIIHFWTGRF